MRLVEPVTAGRMVVRGQASAVVTPRTSVHPWPGTEDRTRTVVDAVLGGLRTGCGKEDQAIRETAGQRV